MPYSYRILLTRASERINTSVRQVLPVLQNHQRQEPAGRICYPSLRGWGEGGFTSSHPNLEAELWLQHLTRCIPTRVEYCDAPKGVDWFLRVRLQKGTLMTLSPSHERKQ
ncbi:hypothetical protein AGOR_G00251590 [Albula goreensis]|uniref:Uncharacterized protein n=1 Tax=Albula goreensis TaxID=1534307 RepID=A0A8T3CC11_9TELE|nr:hypothetical protein AGOR_G00251590 [Albula goreensis]